MVKRYVIQSSGKFQLLGWTQRSYYPKKISNSPIIGAVFTLRKHAKIATYESQKDEVPCVTENTSRCMQAKLRVLSNRRV